MARPGCSPFIGPESSIDDSCNCFVKIYTLTDIHHCFFFSAISWPKLLISKSAQRGGRVPFAFFRAEGLGAGAGTFAVRARGTGTGTVRGGGGAFARAACGGRSGTFSGAGGGGEAAGGRLCSRAFRGGTGRARAGDAGGPRRSGARGGGGGARGGGASENFDARRGARVVGAGAGASENFEARRGAGAGAGASENFEARGLDTSGAAEDRGDREAARLTAVAGRRCTSSVASSRTDTFSPPRWIAVTTPLRTERSGSLKRTRSPTERGARASSASPSSAA